MKRSIIAVLCWLAATFLTLSVGEWAGAQGEGQTKDKAKDKEKSKDKGKQKSEDDFIRKSAEKAMKGPGESERDKLLKELGKVSGPDPSPAKDEVDQWFDRLSGGADIWKYENITHKPIRELYDRIAGRVGAEASITRVQFRQYAAMNLQEGTSPPWKPKDKEKQAASEAEKSFRERDKDRSGFLEREEMSEALRSNLKEWDRNGDGKIDLEEYTAYFYGRVSEATGSRIEPPTIIRPSSIPYDDERPLVIRYGKLPKGLPSWFVDWDTDQDGQIGLYEWRAQNQPIEEFLKLDLNDDGFIQADEWLAWAKANNVTATSKPLGKR